MPKTQRFEVYKCAVCGNIVEVVDAGGGILVCCSLPMEKLELKGKKQEGNEKHVPVVDIKSNKVTVKVGSIPHPMEDKHYIELIELVKGGKVIASARLYPQDKPEAEFTLKDTKGISARILCNIHGMWQS